MPIFLLPFRVLWEVPSHFLAGIRLLSNTLSSLQDIKEMWSALKSDLLDFVTTIKEDTSKTLSLVLGDEEVDVSVRHEFMISPKSHK